MHIVVNYGFYFGDDSSVTIYESDILVKVLTITYTKSTVFGIIYDGIKIKYFIDGYCVYDTPQTLSSPLYANFIIYNGGYNIQNIQLAFLTNMQHYPEIQN